MNVHFNSIENVSRLFWLVYSHIKYGIITQTKATKMKNKKNPATSKKKQTNKQTTQMKTCQTHKIL